MGAVERKLNRDAADATDIAETLPGKRNRAMDDAVGKSDVFPATPVKRCSVGDLHLASVVDGEEVKEHAQWRNPELMSRVDAAASSAAAGVDAAIPTRVADTFSRLLGQE